MKELVIGTRGSALALWQARYVQRRLLQECGISSRITVVKTRGDSLLHAPLSQFGGKGLFTKELEEQLLSHDIDIAVHSLKDVPIVLHPALILACITERADVRDCFLSYDYPSLQALASIGKARIGTTSLRRSMQIHATYTGITCANLRGNIQTRLEKLQSGAFHAIILANAGLQRLGITDIPYMIPLSVKSMIPAMGQGALGIECRSDDTQLCAQLARLHCEKTALCVEAEREFVRVLEGGCSVPLGVHCAFNPYASFNDAANTHSHAQEVLLQAIVGLPNGTQIITESICANAKEATQAARTLATRFVAQGARELLAEARKHIESV